ncbi:MAG TPA: dipeptide epimerase [Pirellulaceae bacterium]|nr:dipeptide epimerase [Pirellulaceae bacterium]
MKLTLHAFDLPLAHTFTISRESITSQSTLIVELESGGIRGYGEATASAYYGFTIERMARDVDLVRPRLEAASPDEPESLWAALHPALKDDPFAHCAIDQAAWDLCGKLRGLKTYELWGLSADSVPASDYTIGIDAIDVMVAKLKEFDGWPIYKIKLGTDRDLEIVRELRRHTAAIFRVDANCGWTADQTIANAAALKELGVEFIEQPLPAAGPASGGRQPELASGGRQPPDVWADQARIYRESALPIIADESCIVESDVERCAGYFHGVNIKLVKCGGLTPARRMISRAAQLGLKVMCGCMTESTVGISAIAQLLPLLDYVDMDGAVLLAKDVASGVKLLHGVCHYADEKGNGVTLLEGGRNPLE